MTDTNNEVETAIEAIQIQIDMLATNHGIEKRLGRFEILRDLRHCPTSTPKEINLDRNDQQHATEKENGANCRPS